MSTKLYATVYRYNSDAKYAKYWAKEFYRIGHGDLRLILRCAVKNLKKGSSASEAAKDILKPNRLKTRAARAARRTKGER